MTVFKKKIKKGYSLLELLLVTGIIAILTVASFVIYNMIMGIVNFDKMDKELLRINTGITKVVNSTGDASFINNQFLAEKGFLTNPIFNYNAGKINYNDVNITFAPGPKNITSVEQLYYEITLSNLTAKDCTRFSNSLFLNSHIKKFSINGQEMNGVDVAALAQNCDNNKNTFYAKVYTATKDYGIILNELMAQRLQKIKQGNKKYNANEVIEQHYEGSYLNCKAPLVFNSYLGYCQCQDGRKWNGQKCVDVVSDGVVRVPKVKADGTIEIDFACKVGSSYDKTSRSCKPLPKPSTLTNLEYYGTSTEPGKKGSLDLIRNNNYKKSNLPNKSIVSPATFVLSENDVFISDKEFTSSDLTVGRDSKTIYVCHKPFIWNSSTKRCEKK